MTARRIPLCLSLLALLAYAPGCAQGGGGDPDAGPVVRPDAGPPRMDAFVPPFDAGPGPDPVDSGTPVDTGTPPVDATTPPVDAGTDAGAPVDAGRDAGTPPACGESPCRLAPPQCGCPSGQACYPTTGGRECATEGTTPEGAACSNQSDCAEGFICASGGCRRMCLTDGDCPGRGSECVHDVTIGPNPLRYCSTACEPASATSCGSGRACRYYEDGGRYYTECVAEGSTGPSGTCSSSNDCTAGYTCVNVFGDRTCMVSCSFDGAGSCFVCFGFLDSAPTIEGTEYGYCPPPE